MNNENMVIGHINALKTELLSRFGLLLKSNKELEERINELELLLISLNNRTFPELENRIITLETIQTDLKMKAELDAIAWCKTHGVEFVP